MFHSFACLAAMGILFNAMRIKAKTNLNAQNTSKARYTRVKSSPIFNASSNLRSQSLSIRIAFHFFAFITTLYYFSHFSAVPRVDNPHEVLHMPTRKKRAHF